MVKGPIFKEDVSATELPKQFACLVRSLHEKGVTIDELVTFTRVIRLVISLGYVPYDDIRQIIVEVCKDK